MLMTASRRYRAYLRATAVSVSAAAAVVLCGSCAPISRAQHAGYCAIMPDSVGLYIGNSVTQMGYPIGKITAITPAMRDVRVDFTVTEPRSLPDNVKAVTRSGSILADRSLELVGNFHSGSRLPAGGCIPLSRSSTSKSLSEIIGSATNFVNSINPNGSSNLGDVVRGLDLATRNTGPRVNHLLTTSSALLDAPDQAIGDIGSIITNLELLTSTMAKIRGPIKDVLYDVPKTIPDVVDAVDGAVLIFNGILPLVSAASDIETELGGEVQQTLDEVSIALRKASAHAPWLASFLYWGIYPWWINPIVNYVNRHQFTTLRWRPPLYRIRTPNNLALCNTMNASLPGSCADVTGTPYAVDASLLQYVLTQAAKR
jgi:phospholipid/cholesterol/gamma-HCH transport system substrate-binding protein